MGDNVLTVGAVEYVSDKLECVLTRCLERCTLRGVLCSRSARVRVQRGIDTLTTSTRGEMN